VRFDSEELVSAYRATGELPRIHRTIAELIDWHSYGHAVAMDLGCCHGLLGVRLHDMGLLSVIGIDANPHYLMNAVRPQRSTRYFLAKVDRTSQAIKVAEIAAVYGVTLVVARRILPEIAEARDPGLVTELAAALHGAGVKAIALEGRIDSFRAKNPLRNADLECEALEPYFKVVDRLGNCRWLEAA
jgi:predicted TPR repeat methyltransferase